MTTKRRVAALAAGTATLAVALAGPFHDRFWLMMVQHELVMLVAAPLLVIGAPRRDAGPSRSLDLPLPTPVAVTLIYAIVLWVWHVPALHQASVASGALHVVKQASFLVAALLFSSVLLRHVASGGAVLCIGATMIHMGLLGALLTLAPVSLYAGVELADQQLGGLILWVPAGTLMLVAGLWAFDRWIGLRS
ncbi:MAG TPA: cytochrome c oxidase assembly protein [Casimicrobiaceae bacterium]|nr:cytochrome c oxidase assembly protein [Casimicrobiaceae bacterium]